MLQLRWMEGPAGTPAPQPAHPLGDSDRHNKRPRRPHHQNAPTSTRKQAPQSPHEQQRTAAATAHWAVAEANRPPHDGASDDPAVPRMVWRWRGTTRRSHRRAILCGTTALRSSCTASRPLPSLRCSRRKPSNRPSAKSVDVDVLIEDGMRRGAARSRDKQVRI
ncbi:hypothetical protein OH77DRAFT_216633 [Trametes cingulata]|nr:hypothetical protein OH77DRAFT_216633 [Trametes cingulata]